MSNASRRLVAGLAAAELPILVAISPTLLFPSPRRVLIALLIPIVWVCHRRIGGDLVPRTPLNASLFLLLCMVVVSIAVTFDVRFSLGKVSGVVLGVSWFWAMTRWITTRQRMAAGLAAFLAAGGVLALVALLGVSWITKFSAFGSVIDRLPKIIRGLPGAEEGFQANAVAGCLVLFIPLQIILLGGGAHRWPHFWQTWRGGGRRIIFGQAALLTLTAGTLLLTQSRGAWVGLFVSAVLFFAWHNHATRIVAAAIAGGAAILTLVVGPGPLIGAAMRGSGPGMIGDVSGRIELWSRALDGIQDFPLTGMGMNAFRKVMPVVYPTLLTSPDLDISHAHNHLLQAALDLGLPGLIAYLSIWVVTGVLLVRVHRRSDDRAYQLSASGLGAGLIAHFVFSMTDAIALGAKVGILFWFSLALAVSLHRVALPPPGGVRA
jgi:O-antigen ligase/polysaccharide polymerase Wzy-like membrane protein